MRTVTHVGAGAELEGLCSCCSHSSGDSDKWGQCLVVASAHGDVAPAKSCPHQLCISHHLLGPSS